MTILKKTGLVLLCALMTACGSSSSTTNKNNALAHSEDIVGDVQEFDISGIHVLLRQSAAVPVVSAILFIKGGANMTPANEPIMTETFAMAIAAASGSQRTPKSIFRRRMVRMGGGILGEAGNDYSALTMTCTRENLDTTWKYFTDIATRPAFDSVEFTNYKQAQLIGLSSFTSNAEVFTRHEADSIYFAGHPYGRVPSVKDVQAITLDLIKQHFRSIMVKSRFLLSVVGNISRDELTNMVESTIGTLPVGNFNPQPIGTPVKAMTPGVFLYQFERKLPTNYVLGYFNVPSQGDSDYYPYLRLRNFFGGFVFNHIRVQHNLAYSPNVDDRQAQSSIGYIDLQTPYVDSAIKIIYNDVDFFQNNLIRESAIREGVAGWATRNYLKAETTIQQAINIGQAKLMTGDWHDAFFSYQKLSKVTSEQLAHAAQKYLRNFNWFIVGDTTGIDRSVIGNR